MYGVFELNTAVIGGCVCVLSTAGGAWADMVTKGCLRCIWLCITDVVRCFTSLPYYCGLVQFAADFSPISWAGCKVLPDSTGGSRGAVESIARS